MEIVEQIMLKEVAEVFTGPPMPSARVRTVLRETGPVVASLITVGAIGDGAVVPGEIKTAFAQSGSALRDYRVGAGDILLAARSTVIRCAMVTPESEGSIVTASVLAVRCDRDRLLPRMLMAFFEHHAGRSALLGASQSTTEQYSLTVRTVKELVVAVPPIEVQQRMVALLEAAAAARAASEEAIRIRYQTALEIAVTSMTHNANGDGGSSL